MFTEIYIGEIKFLIKIHMYLKITGHSWTWKFVF